MTVLSLCYGNFNLSQHDVVTCSSKPTLTGYLSVYSHGCIIIFLCIHFYAYFEIWHPQLEFLVTISPVSKFVYFLFIAAPASYRPNTHLS